MKTSIFVAPPVPPDLIHDDPSKLDNLPHSELFACAERAITANSGSYSKAIAQRLDQLFETKLVRLLRATQTTESHLTAVDNLIGRLSRDKYQDQLDDLPGRYFARWQSLRDVISVAMAVDEWEHSLREKKDQTIQDSVWEVVASALLAMGREGMLWSNLARLVIDSGAGPNSKGGVSSMLTAMRASGWVEVLPEPQGNRKRVFVGQRISESKAWVLSNGRDESTPTAEVDINNLLMRVERLENKRDSSERWEDTLTRLLGDHLCHTSKSTVESLQKYGALTARERSSESHSFLSRSINFEPVCLPSEQ